MPYSSIDELQRFLASGLFSRTNDAKKAAGRALGTLVEIITYYLLKTWNLQKNLAIETKLPEYGENDITHNVEFTLHKSIGEGRIAIQSDGNISSLFLANKFCLKDVQGFIKARASKIQNCIDNYRIIKNSTIVGYKGEFFYNSYIDSSSESCFYTKLFEKPFAMLECKRVGKEGDVKGPQTIEKAKQGAYVARMVSSLQRIYDEQNNLKGFLIYDGKQIIDDYYHILERIISGDLYDCIDNFILTIGIVSNHGNWFTASNMNKELKVLKNSYDWLIFLKDEGLASFAEDILRVQACKEAFIYSYSKSPTTGKKNRNIFTKSVISYKADEYLTRYFKENYASISNWFEVLSPNSMGLEFLKQQLLDLKGSER